MDSAQFLTGFIAADLQRRALAKLPVELDCGRKEMGQQFGLVSRCRLVADGEPGRGGYESQRHSNWSAS